MKTLLLNLSLILTLASCATLSEEECHTGNWKDIGYADGQSGKTMKQYSSHLKACSEYNIKPNIETYRLGRNQGLSEYCEPSKAFDYGHTGKPYLNVCIGKNSKKFSSEYNLGKSIYVIKTELDSIRTRLVQNKNDMDFFKASPERVQSLRRDNKRLSKRKHILKAKLIIIQVKSKRNLEDLLELL